MRLTITRPSTPAHILVPPIPPLYDDEILWNGIIMATLLSTIKRTPIFSTSTLLLVGAIRTVLLPYVSLCEKDVA